MNTKGIKFLAVLAILAMAFVFVVAIDETEIADAEYTTEEGVATVSTEAELKAAMADDKVVSVKLGASFDASAVDLTKSLDLNGKTLTDNTTSELLYLKLNNSAKDPTKMVTVSNGTLVASASAENPGLNMTVSEVSGSTNAGIVTFDHVNFTVDNCRFFMRFTFSTVIFDTCTFDCGEKSKNIHMNGAADAPTLSVTMNNCTFEGNWSEDFNEGAISIESTLSTDNWELILNNTELPGINLFVNNSTTEINISADEDSSIDLIALNDSGSAGVISDGYTWHFPAKEVKLLDNTLTINEGGSLTIMEGQMFNLNGQTLTNNGSILNAGTLDISEYYAGEGDITCSAGTLTISDKQYEDEFIDEHVTYIGGTIMNGVTDVTPEEKEKEAEASDATQVDVLIDAGVETIDVTGDIDVTDITVSAEETVNVNIAGEVSGTISVENVVFNIDTTGTATIGDSGIGTENLNINNEGTVEITLVKDSSDNLVVSGTLDGATMTATDDSTYFIVPSGTTMTAVTFVADKASVELSMSITGGEVKLSVGSIMIGGVTTSTADIVAASADIDAGSDVLELSDVTINKAEDAIKITSANKVKVTGTVTIGAGVTIEIPADAIIELEDDAILKGAGTLYLKAGAITDFGTGTVQCKIETESETKIVMSETDLDDLNMAAYDSFILGQPVSISTIDVTIPEGKELYLGEYDLTIDAGRTFSISGSKIYNDGGVINVNGTLSINSADVFADVVVADSADVIMVKSKTLEISGQTVSNLSVGYGNTLILKNVTIENGNGVFVYGTLKIEGNTKVAYGSELIINKYATATVDGSFTNSGEVSVYGKMTVNGTMNISGSKDKNALIYVTNGSEDSPSLIIAYGATVNVVKPNGTTYENTLISLGEYSTEVLGTLNLNGSFIGYIQDRGEVKVNSIVGTPLVGYSTIYIYDGITVDIASVDGTIVISDYKAATDVKGDLTAADVSEGNAIRLYDIKGVKISEAVNTVTKSDGTRKYFYADMTVSGVANVVDTSGYIRIAGTTTSIGESSSARTAYVIVADTLSIGEDVDLLVATGTFVIDGALNVIEEGTSATVSSGAFITVKGLATIGGKKNSTTTIAGSGTVNGCYYQIYNSTDAYYTGYYTNADDAFAKLADAYGNTVTVYGKNTLEASATIASNQELIVASNGELTVGSKATLTVSDGAVVTNNNKISVSGSMIIVNYEGYYSGNEPQADVVATSDNQRTYTSLSGAIKSGATYIILNRNVTLRSDLTIPAGVTVVNEKNGADITVKKNKTLTVDGALLLPSGTVTLEAATPGSSDIDGQLIVNGYVVTKTALDNKAVAGAYFDGKYNGKSVKYTSGLSYAAENVTDGNITVYGKVTGDEVVFIEGKNKTLEIIIHADSAVSVKSIELVGATLTINGTMSGFVVASSGLESLAVDATIALSKASGITIASETIEETVGAVDYVYLSGNLAGSAAVMTGVVTINAASTIVNSEDNSMYVLEDAEVVLKDATFTVTAKAAIYIDGTVSVTGATADLIVNGEAIVTGYVSLEEKAKMDINGKAIVTGTIVASVVLNKESYIDVNAGGVLIVGTKPTEVGSEAAIIGYVDLTTTGYIKAYPASDLSLALIEWDVVTETSGAIETEYVINGTLYMTAYALSNQVAIYKLVYTEEFELEGKDVGLYYADDSANNTGLYKTGAWFSDAAMSANKKISDTTTKITADYPAVYAWASSSTVYGTVSVGTGLNLYIDGVPVDSSSYYALTVGTHTVKFDVYAGYDGDKATLSFNGKTITSGSSITIDSDDIYFSLVAEGAVPHVEPEPEPVTPEEKSEWTITTILLCVLVVLIAIMAVIVALRLNRN